MPRCIRNFWIDAHIDGRRRPIATGPRSTCGGFSLAVFYRDRGTIARPLRMTGRCISGRLLIDIDDNGTTVYRKETER